MDEKQELKELREQNKDLRKLVDLYNSGQSKIVICSRCNIPLLSDESRVRVVLNKRGKDYTKWAERQIAVFHQKCWEKLK